MEIGYLGIKIDFITYISLLLGALIIFLIIWIFSEIKRQKKYSERLKKLRKAEIKLIG